MHFLRRGKGLPSLRGVGSDGGTIHAQSKSGLLSTMTRCRNHERLALVLVKYTVIRVLKAHNLELI